MFMLRLIETAINLKDSRKRVLFRFCPFLYCVRFISGYLWYSSSTAYADNDNDNSEKENAIRRWLGLFAKNCGLH